MAYRTVIVALDTDRSGHMIMPTQAKLASKFRNSKRCRSTMGPIVGWELNGPERPTAAGDRMERGSPRDAGRARRKALSGGNSRRDCRGAGQYSRRRRKGAHRDLGRAGARPVRAGPGGYGCAD